MKQKIYRRFKNECPFLITVLSTLALALLITPAVAAQTNWESIGPGGGYFPRLVADPSDSNTIFGCADDVGGVYRTTNAGTSWSLVTEEIENFGAWDLAIDPDDTDIVYAIDFYGRNRPIKSTNGGSAWSIIGDGMTDPFPVDTIQSCIAIDPTDTDRIFIGTGEATSDCGGLGGGDGLYRSEDAGATWERVDFTGEVITDIEVDVNGWVYVGVQDEGLYRSKSNGDSSSFSKVFDTSTNGGGPLAITLWITNAGVSPVEHDVWFAYYGSSNSIYKSSSNGDSSTYTGKGLANNFIWEIAQMSANTLYISVFGEGVKETTNGGTSWSTVNGTSSNGLNEALTMLGITTTTNATLFTSNYGNEGIYKSTNYGSTWTQSNSGVNAYLTTSLRFAPSNDYRIYVTSAAGYDSSASSLSHRSAYGTISSTSPYAVTWTQMDDIVGHATNIAIAPDDDDHIIVTTFALGFYVSTGAGNSGTTQEAYTSGSEYTLTMGAAFDPDDSDIAVVGGNPLTTSQSGCWGDGDTTGPTKRLYRTEDGGANWDTTQTYFFAQDIIAEGSSSDYMWAATDIGVYYSTDNGENWSADTDLNNQLSGNDLFLNCIAQDPSDSDNIYVGSFTGEVWYTDDAGANWSQLGGSSLANGAEIKRIIVDPDAGDWLYVAVNGCEREDSSGDSVDTGGIYAVDTGSSPAVWYDLTTSNLKNDMVWGMDFNVYGSKRMLYTGHYDGSCHRIDLQ